MTRKASCGHEAFGRSDRCAVMSCSNYYMKDNPTQEPLGDQIERLAKFIMENVPGEPSQNEGAVDCAIRILSKHYPKDVSEKHRG